MSVPVISARRRWAVAALLVTVGWLVTPQPVPVYDGVGAPDEPYRFVLPPKGARATAPPTTGTMTSPVRNGTNTNGMSIQTAEQGPQASLFIPPMALASPGTSVTVTFTPQAPMDQPKGARIDGNVYLLTVADPAGPVTKTDRAAIATLYLRATTAVQPGPLMQYRSDPAMPWKAVKTSRGGQDVYVSAYQGTGQYSLAFVDGQSSGRSVLPFVVLGALVLLVVVVVVVRLRATSE